LRARFTFASLDRPGWKGPAQAGGLATETIMHSFEGSASFAEFACIIELRRLVPESILISEHARGG
jgi:hypothetical protein